MQISPYAVSTPIDAVVFDCDGTLSAIEGIEILAKQNGVGERVAELTERAMSEEGITPSLYEERLSLVKPARKQVIDLAQQYYAARSEDVLQVIRVLQSLGKMVFVMSAGVNPAVQLFSTMLDIPVDHVFAVDLSFSPDGDYIRYDTAAEPANNAGKRVLMEKLKEKYPEIVHVGDGMNDVAVLPVVQRFVGYGGAKFRQKIADISPFYIMCASMAPLLPLCLTAEEAATLDETASQLYQTGQSAFAASKVICH